MTSQCSYRSEREREIERRERERKRERITYNCFGARRVEKKTYIVKWPGKKKDVKQMYIGQERKEKQYREIRRERTRAL